MFAEKKDYFIAPPTFCLLIILSLFIDLSQRFSCPRLALPICSQETVAQVCQSETLPFQLKSSVFMPLLSCKF